MSIEIHERKKRQESSLPLDDSGEIIRRWHQFRIICNRSGGYLKPMTAKIASRGRPGLFEGVQAIWLMSSIVTLFIAARIGLKLVTIDPGTPLGHVVVGLTDMLLRPFSGATETMTMAHITVLELSALHALIIYPFAAWCLVKLLQYFYNPAR